MRIVFNLSLLVIFTAYFAKTARAGVFYEDGATTMHFAFEGSPNDDRPIVRPPAFYHADDGFGFVDSPALVANRQGVSAPKYFRFDVNLPDGNYDVAVTLGNPDAVSITTVKAEGHRPMLLDVRTAAREAVTKTFTVNVQKGKLGDSEPLDRDGRLNLEFVGVNPSLQKLDIKPNPKAITVYLAGRWSVCDEDEIPVVGWGQMLPLFFKPGEVAVSNQASSGDNSVVADRLKSISSTIKAGDYLLIEFNTNAEFDRPNDANDFKAWLRPFIDAARKHDATPVLITPPPAHPKSKLDQLIMWADPGWVRELAANQKVPLIDLTPVALAFLDQLGPQQSDKAFAKFPPSMAGARAPIRGLPPFFSAYGAYEIAKLVAQAIKDQKLDLASHLTGNLATNLDPAKFPAHLGYDFLLNNK